MQVQENSINIGGEEITFRSADSPEKFREIEKKIDLLYTQTRVPVLEKKRVNNAEEYQMIVAGLKRLVLLLAEGSYDEEKQLKEKDSQRETKIRNILKILQEALSEI